MTFLLYYWFRKTQYVVVRLATLLETDRSVQQFWILHFWGLIHWFMHKLHLKDCMISHFICVFSTVTTARCSSSCISALQSFKPLCVGFENVRYKGCASFSTTATYAIRNICLHSLLSTHAHAHAHSGFKLLLTSASSKSVTLLDAAAHITPRLQVKLKRS